MTALHRIERPAGDEHAAALAAYVGRVPGDDALEPLVTQIKTTAALLLAAGEEKGRHRYAPGKWSVKEIAVHMADFERVFAFRALHFARGAATPLPPFDENAWTPESHADGRPMSDIVDECRAVRAASLALFRSFDAEHLLRRGTASGNSLSVRAAIWSIAGHERHHVAILRDRYGLGG